MSIHVPFARASGIGLACLVLLVGAAQPAAAKQDWLGWLEEFSGPGPFQGFELSVEFACLNVVNRDTISRAALVTNFPQVAAARIKAQDSLTTLRTFTNRPTQGVYDFNAALASGKLKEAYIEGLLAGVQVDFNALNLPPGDPGQTALQAASLNLSNFRALTAEALQNAPKVTKTKAKTFGQRSCWGAQGKIDEARTEDRRSTATRINELLDPSAPPSDAELYGGRRDWQTGLVVNVGGFWSEENRLFDPDGTRSGNDEEPQLRVIPLEFLAHHKLSPAIDIGAGLGVAFFHTDFHNDPWRPTKNAAFYLVPLSVVVRPAAMFTNQRWAAALGYRVGLRYFGNLEGKDFGRPESDLPLGQKYFKQNGEFVWGAAAFFDLNALMGR